MKEDVVESPSRRAELAFGERVRRLRRAKGLTQADLAKQLAAHGYELHPSAIAKIEGASRPTSVGEAVAIAMILDVETRDLVRPSVGEVAQARVDAALLEVQEVKARLRDMNIRIAALTAEKGKLTRELAAKRRVYDEARRSASPRTKLTVDGEKSRLPTVEEFMTQRSGPEDDDVDGG